jgi:hypothetical protein
MKYEIAIICIEIQILFLWDQVRLFPTNTIAPHHKFISNYFA